MACQFYTLFSMRGILARLDTAHTLLAVKEMKGEQLDLTRVGSAVLIAIDDPANNDYH